MSEASRSPKRISVAVRSADGGAIEQPLIAYSFDAKGSMVAATPVRDGTLELTAKHHGNRVLLAPPLPEEERPTFRQLERRGALQPRLKEGLRGGFVQELLVPPEWLELLPWCFCRIRGRVVRNIAGQDLPVCGARVHICEVDRVWWWIQRLPDLDVIRLRDDLLPKLEVLPPKQRFALGSSSAPIVRAALLEDVELIRPLLCLLPYWYRLVCDEVRVIETDEHGGFDTFMIYPCKGDKPDLYFWVEYQLGGTWEAVYRPPMACHTHWDYECGTEVTLRVSDPRVPVCGDQEQIDGCAVAVLSIGNGISVREVQTAGASEGLTTGGRPLGGSLEPHVWFGRECLFSKGITKYRWSYRRVGASGWTIMDKAVGRYYVTTDPVTGDLAFPLDVLGPDPSNLFRIKPIDPPAGGIEWFVVNARTDTATAYFQSDTLSGGNALAAAGKYEIKLELFHDDGTLVNWTDAGVDLQVPVVGEAAPFTAETLDAESAPAYYRILDAAGDTLGFRMVLHVDNNPCNAVVHPITGTFLSINDCGFVEYQPASQVTLSFEAEHPNGFATFDFDVILGNSTVVPTASADGKVGDTVADGFLLTSTSPHEYAKTLPVGALTIKCPSAAFAEMLRVRAMATDGWSGRLTYLDDFAPAAFALTPADP